MLSKHRIDVTARLNKHGRKVRTDGANSVYSDSSDQSGEQDLVSKLEERDLAAGERYIAPRIEPNVSQMSTRTYLRRDICSTSPLVLRTHPSHDYDHLFSRLDSLNAIFPPAR